jgi:Histidine kinase-, DNA gyrase B-, and HSP90-like ATPase
MGQTRVDLLHLLEDLRDAYPGDLEETILTEIVANSLDSGARHLRVLTDPVDRTLVVVDDGRGMGRRELSRYHDVAASTKERGEGIGFAGVGIKLGLLVAEEVLTETRRDWLGVTCTSPSLVAGLVEAPGLAAVLTLNKGDFVRAGRRGITYLAYRKAIQEAASRQLAAWGEARDREDTARRKAARPLEKDLETVLVDLAEDYPALTALVERRAGGQRRLPTGKGGALAAVVAEPERDAASPEAAVEGAGSEELEPRSPVEPPSAADAAPPADEPGPSTFEPPAAAQGPRKPSRYGLAIDFEDQRDRPELGRLVESTIWVNTAHPAYARAVASRAEGYHVALTVGLSLAPLAAEPGKSQEFLTEFLARWGDALGRDRRRRGRGPR